MKHTMKRSGWLLGTGSVLTATACSGGRAIPGTTGPLGTVGSPSSASPYFNFVRSQTTPLSTQKLSQAQVKAALSASTFSYDDPSTYMTTVNAGNGASTTYLADGSLFASWSTSVNADSSIATSVTMYDGSQYSTVAPPPSAFSSNGTTTIGNVTIIANASNGVYAATVQTASGPVAISVGQNSDGTYYQTTTQYGTVTIPQAAMAWMQPLQQPTAQSVSRAKPEYWGDANCNAAIAALLVVVALIVAAFWYFPVIIAQFAAGIYRAIQGIGLVGANPVTIPAATAFASMIAAFLAAFSAAVLWINNACGPRPPTPEPEPTEEPEPTLPIHSGLPYNQ